MTLFEHLAELRMRIIRCSLALLVGMIVVVAFYEQVLNWLLEPYAALCARKPKGFCGTSYDAATASAKLVNRDPIAGLSTRFKIGFYGGIVLALPVLLWQLWKFIVPALHKHEKRYAFGFVFSSVVLFACGGAVAFLTLEKSLEFLISWAGKDVVPLFEVQAYVRLIVLMVVAFGVGFLIPVLLVFLEMINVVKPRAIAERLALRGGRDRRRRRRHHAVG